MTPNAEPTTPATTDEQEAVSLKELALDFLRLGALGFGGPIALAGYMQRDLEETRRWITGDEYQDGPAIAQTMPGPLAAQLAMWIGFIRYGVAGATLTGLLFILPPFLHVVAIAAAYVHFEGISQIRAVFYGVGPAAIAVIVLAAWKLAKTTDGKYPKQWAMSAVPAVITIVTQTELAWLFIVAGVLGIVIYAWPRRRRVPSIASTLRAVVPWPRFSLPMLAATGIRLGSTCCG